MARLPNPHRAQQKTYRWHTQYPGGLQELKYPEFLAKHPNGPVEKAVYGMLPKNNLRKLHMKRLLVFPDEDHPYGLNILKHYDKEYEARLQEQMERAEEELIREDEERLLVRGGGSNQGQGTVTRS